MSIRKLLLTLCIPFTVACVTTSDGGRDGSQSARGPLGKADHFGSCAATDGTDHCGGPSDGSCFCDDACVVFGDCCADKVAVCGGGQPGPGPDICLADSDCGDGEVCDDTKCFDCGDGGICPAVCFGECVDQDVEEPTLCLTDAACGFAEICDHSECHSAPCPEGFSCPAVCHGECVEADQPAFCGDDGDCGEGEFCAEACVPSCPVCEDCNNVCLPKDAIDPDPDPGEPALCLVDDDCDGELTCDHSECHSAPCPEGFACPAVCMGECA